MKITTSIIAVQFLFLSLFSTLAVFANDVKSSPSTAADFNEVLDAANRGDINAQLKMGSFYLDGSLVEHNSQKAIEWFSKANQAGSASAANSLGSLYSRGVGVERDLEEAFAFYKLSSERGSDHGTLNLAMSYISGKGVEQDPIKGVELLTAAAESGFVPAQHNLGQVYQHGVGVDKNYKKAFKWLTKASNQDYSSAQYGLAGSYANGHGTKKSMTKAIKLYEKSANNGNTGAMFNMGIVYRDGEGGISPNFEKSVEWFQKAVAQGHAPSQFALGVLTYQGQGTVKSEEKANELITASAKQGYKPAYDLLHNRSGASNENAPAPVDQQQSVEDTTVQLWTNKEIILATFDVCITNVNSSLGENVALKTSWQKDNKKLSTKIEQYFTKHLSDNANKLPDGTSVDDVKALLRGNLRTDTQADFENIRPACNRLSGPIEGMTKKLYSFYERNSKRLENKGENKGVGDK